MLLLLTPIVDASWMFAQSWEPDTSYDENDRLMWTEAAPIGVTNQVYFAAFSYVDDTGTNPNVGAARTRIEVPADEHHEALLGVWVDCNADGYVGMAETALREYPNELLLDDTACPEVVGSNQRWTDGAHNYNGLVTELIPISRHESIRDERRYVDFDARVWGDFHRPDERPTHRSCALNPQPRGTYQSTGGAMNYVDCRYDILGTWNQAMDAAGDPLALKFADTDDARTGPLGQIQTFGSEDSQHSAVHFVDCSAPPLVNGGDTINGTLGNDNALWQLEQDNDADTGIWETNVSMPAPTLGNTNDPNVPGTYNATNEELNGDCDTTNDFGHDWYGGVLGESDFNGVNPNNKLEADWNFGVAGNGTNRGGFPVSLLGPFGGSGSAGWNEGDYGVGWGGVRWTADSTWLSKTGPGTLRVDVASASVEIAPAYWLTFYAHLGPSTYAKGLVTPGGSGVYGSWHCAGEDSGIHNGWNCDADAWYQNPDGSFASDPLQRLARPGWPYELRDVDCYDGGNVAGAGVQPAAYGPAPCPTV